MMEPTPPIVTYLHPDAQTPTPPYTPTRRKDGSYLVQFCRGPAHKELRVIPKALTVLLVLSRPSALSLKLVDPMEAAIKPIDPIQHAYRIRWGFMGGEEHDLPDLLYDWVDQ